MTAAAATPSVLPPPDTTLLRSLFTPQRLRDHLLSRESWRPFPAASDRAGWDALPESARRELVAQAKEHLGMEWPALPATLFLEFRRNGNRSRYEAPHFARRAALLRLVVAECAEGQGRFLDDVVNGVWAICEESFWGVSAHNGRHSPRFAGAGLPDTSFPEVDLFAAETGALLAWTHYLLGDQLRPELPIVLDRIEREVRARILVPYGTIDDWVWLGKRRRPVNNWNPWIHSNVLSCALLLEDDAQRRQETVLRAVEGLDVFLDGYHPDGGCDEGTSYWGRAGASLFDCLDLLRSATDGALDAFGIPLVREIGRYVYRMHIGENWYVNFADGPAKLTVDGRLIYRYGQRTQDRELAAHGAYAARFETGRLGRGASAFRTLSGIFEPIPDEEQGAAPPLIRHHWLDGIHVLVARERERSAAGLFLAAKGGHNAESHNHNDVGHFVVALDGHPVIIDVGVETYTRQTFGPERYTIWTMQSAYHNLPLIDGHQQGAGREFAARGVAASISEATAELALDIAGAYPSKAGVRHWRRSVRLERAAVGASAQVVLRDEYELARPPAALALHLMTSGEVDTTEVGVLRVSTPTRPLLVRYDASQLTATTEAISTNDDARLVPVWGERVFRTVLSAMAPKAEATWVLTIS